MPLSDQSQVRVAQQLNGDHRGSLHRGAAWEAWLRGRLGQVELSDQVEVLHWLSSVTGYLDLSRVAIHGWSYGGYLSLMGLIQYPSEFKVGIHQ